MYMVTLKGQGQKLTWGQGHEMTWVGQVVYHSMRLDERNALVAFVSFYHFPIKSYWQKHLCDLRWLQVTSVDLCRDHSSKIGLWSSLLSYSDMLLKEWERSDGYEGHLNFLPLTYNGKVTKLTWPKVTSSKIPRYTFCRYWYSNIILKVSYRLIDNCDHGSMVNFEKSDLRSGHLAWPGDLACDYLGLKFIQNMRNECPNR